MDVTTEPLCYDCLTADVAVKVIDLCGFEHWFCAADWQAAQDFHDKLAALLAEAMRRLEADASASTGGPL